MVDLAEKNKHQYILIFYYFLHKFYGVCEVRNSHWAQVGTTTRAFSF